MTVAKRTAARKTTAECNAPDCRREPKTRGLCDPHYATHRGLANPKTEDKTDE